MTLTPYNQTLNLPNVFGTLPDDFDPSLWSTPELREYPADPTDIVPYSARLFATHLDSRRWINVAFGRDLADIIDRNPAHADWIRAAVKR